MAKRRPRGEYNYARSTFAQTQESIEMFFDDQVAPLAGGVILSLLTILFGFSLVSSNAVAVGIAFCCTSKTGPCARAAIGPPPSAS